MSADVIYMKIMRDKRARDRLFKTRREDDLHLHVAEARMRYAEADAVFMYTHALSDGIEAAHRFHEYKHALAQIGKEITDDQVMYPWAVDIGQSSREAVARVRTKLRAKHDGTV